MTEKEALEQLNEFLDGRTVGTWPDYGLDEDTSRLHWRGPGYDEGWEFLTDEEVHTFLGLCTTVFAARIRAKAEKND